MPGRKSCSALGAERLSRNLGVADDVISKRVQCLELHPAIANTIRRQFPPDLLLLNNLAEVQRNRRLHFAYLVQSRSLEMLNESTQQGCLVDLASAAQRCSRTLCSNSTAAPASPL